MHEGVILEVIGISKSFGGIVANDRVDFDLKQGEIHVLLGENGAGKSTLMNIISGLYRADGGQIRLQGQTVETRGPGWATDRGIGMVHQHFMLIPGFTVTENIILGKEVTRGISLDLHQARRTVGDLAAENGMSIDPDAKTESLSLGTRQWVEILKALYRRVSILIMDEPTAVLTPQEVEELFKIMRRLAGNGVAVVFITHKLKEVMEVADRITIMRRGRVIGTTTPDKTDQSRLASLMVGREVGLQTEKEPSVPGSVLLEVDHLTLEGDPRSVSLREISFSIRSGEVLGIAGIQGNGQTQLAHALAGFQTIDHGAILLDGREIAHLAPRSLVKAGVAHIPEDRTKHGLVMSYSLADNQVLSTYHRRPYARGGIRNRRAVYENAVDLMKRFDIRASGPDVVVGTLSGGNQQKVIVSRELSRNIRLLVANQPTRGLDVGSIEYVHRRVIEMRDRGVAVLLISSELDEIMALSDRVAVMFRGQLSKVFSSGEAARDELGLLMTGSGARRH